MKKIGEILDKALPDSGIIAAVKAGKIYGDWSGVVGQIIAKHSWPHSFRNGTLVIATESPAWGQEIRMASDQILTKLNNKANEKIFTDIRIIIEKPSLEKSELEE